MSERVVRHDACVLASKGTFFDGKDGRCRQSDAKAADVNAIVARFDFDALNRDFQARLAAGEAPWRDVDVSQMGSFHEMVELVRRSSEYFDRLPADVRAAFRNEPSVMVDAWSQRDPAYVEVFQKIGFLDKDPDAVADVEEAKREARAEKRREARELEARIKAAKTPQAQQST